ncbi:hypothetical protein Tco_0347989 [Tanacetum coccineum]
MSDITTCLNDLSYIPPNNEQNEPTQGDIDETSNKPNQAIRNELEELYASANEELYPGYKLPPSYYAIKKTFKTIGLGYESIHACVNDCFLFRGDNNKDLHFCPVCKTSRWKDSNTPGKKVPKKVLRYFPIIPRLQRLYKSSHTAKEMTWHATGKCTEPGKMQHPVDGRAWKNFDTKYPNFAKEPRNVRLGLAADGFNPFGNLSQAYSMWPVILTTYNLPPWLCMKESSFMLTLLIPGPKSPGKDIDVYLRPLIDDLKVLWALKGVETIDVATGQKFNMRAMVLWTINDFPARSSLSGWSGQGYKACPTCNEDTPSVRVLGKTAYVGHRRFLKKPHKWRRSLEFNGEIEDGDPPRKFDRDQIQAQLARLPTRVKGKHPSYGGVKIKRNVLVELNWTKRSIFYELEYWSFLTLKHNLDIMHIEKNVLEAILNTLLMNDKSKDTAKARQDLKRLGIQSGLWLGQTKNGKCSKPQAAYSFTPENKKKFCQFIKGVKLPDEFGSNFKHKVTNNDTNIMSLKSHDCHIMMKRLLPYKLQQYFPDEVAKPIIKLCSFFKQICSATLMEADTLKAQSKVIDILRNLKLIYPPAFFDIMIHLVIHLPLEALEGGHIRPRWMFPFKRFMKKLKGYVQNKSKLEGLIAEGYVAEEALTFSSYYFRDVTTKLNRLDRNVDPLPQRVSFSPEIDMYRSQFKSKFPNKDMKEEFLDWFGSQIRRRQVDNDPGVSATSELFALACGPTPTPISVNSCVVNGVRFVMHSRDERRTTQNSGICSPGGKDEEMYYGQLQEILEFSYLSFKVVLFRVKCLDTSNEGRKVKHLVLRNNMTQILTKGEVFKDDQYILATKVKQCFYFKDMARRQPHWKVVEHMNHKKFLDGGVIVVEEDPDVIHFDNSSDLPFSTSLNDLDNATLHIDGQSTEVDALPDIIDLDEDGDIIDDEDAIPRDLADSDDEDLVNVVDDDDDVSRMFAWGLLTVPMWRMIVPPTTPYTTGAGVAYINQANAPENPIWVEGKRAGCKPNFAGRLHHSLMTKAPSRSVFIDPNMPDLEDASNAFSNDGIFNGAYDDENVGAVADFNNMDDTINVSPIPTLRIHKDHPKDQILGDPKSVVQTRGKIQNSAQQALNISQALQDESWVEAMQEELLQFKLQKVWILVDLPSRKKAIGTKRVFKNKRDERKAIKLFLAFASYMGFTVYQMDVKSAFLYGTIEEEVYVHQPPGFVDPAHPNKVYKVIKALYGLHQAPRAWYETLSSFLMENGFRRGTIDKTLFIKKKKSDIMLVQVYVDDIIFGSTKKSLCTEFEDYMHKRFQMSSMGELTFFLGLQVKQQPDGIFISQDKYVADILKKFDFWSIRTASTPIESNKPLIKDDDGEDVDVHVYRSMIGSLMYLTASRPDIMFAVCACARFQVTLKASHLNAVKRIFRYLKHQPKLGLWYPRDSPFELEAFSDSDYGGASLDRKSTTGGCQFLGRRLISWQCKKQTIMANSTTEAEYVAAANCCGQVLWIQNQMMDYGFNFMNTRIHIDNESTISVIKNLVAHSRTKHIKIRFHFIRDCYKKILIEVIKIHTDSNVADLLTKGFDVIIFNFLVVSIGMLNL